MKNFDEEDFANGVCEFDCYLLDPDYKSKIMSINPQISKE